MSELNLQLLAFFKVIAVAIFSLLYGLGGMYKKAIRRIGGAIWLMIAIGIIGYFQKTISLWYFLYPLLLMGALTIGYGADEFEEKIKKRALYGLALGVSALPVAIVTGKWLLFGFHTGLCLASSILLGVFNPLRSARGEETLIGTLSVITPIFMV